MSAQDLQNATVLSNPPDDPADQYAITVTGPPPDDQRRVLKHQDTFAIFDRYGDIRTQGPRGEGGVFHDGTRHLARWELSIDGVHPLLLNSAVDEENISLNIDMTNPDLSQEDGQHTPHGAIHIHRRKMVWDGTCTEEVQFLNYETHDFRCTLRLGFSADFVDLFEVRGAVRERRGELLPPRLHRHGITLAYQGLDGIRRTTTITTEPHPTRLTSRTINLDVEVPARGQKSICISIACGSTISSTPALGCHAVGEKLQGRISSLSEGLCRIETSNGQFNRWLSRSWSDLCMMLTETPHGVYPYAGVPWYSTVFGRDGLITALQLLWLQPSLSRGVLRFLATHQSKTHDPECDAEPGKILHEMRGGEMAALREIPFGLYFGTIDATPLFLFLAAEYFQRTSDRLLIEELWPNIEAALEWMETYGDRDGDGFLEYERATDSGLVQQGWRDAQDSVFHSDGQLAKHPIALCEVQSYKYGALRGISRVARELGRINLADALDHEAAVLFEKFDASFWLEDFKTYALALDGDKRPCRVRGSSAAQCLLGGIAGSSRAHAIGQNVLQESMFSGWGIRTIDARESRYNPMSYHNGSIWPHDNAMIALGLSQYGLVRPAVRIMEAMFHASRSVELGRLPELFCGFPRRHSQGPTLYPVACSPQAWSSGSVFMLLQACLSLSIDTRANRVILRKPILPDFLREVSLLDLQVGQSLLDIHFLHHRDDIGVSVTRKCGDAEVLVMK